MGIIEDQFNYRPTPVEPEQKIEMPVKAPEVSEPPRTVFSTNVIYEKRLSSDDPRLSEKSMLEKLSANKYLSRDLPRNFYDNVQTPESFKNFTGYPNAHSDTPGQYAERVINDTTLTDEQRTKALDMVRDVTIGALIKHHDFERVFLKEPWIEHQHAFERAVLAHRDTENRDLPTDNQALLDSYKDMESARIGTPWRQRYQDDAKELQVTAAPVKPVVADVPKVEAVQAEAPKKSAVDEFPWHEIGKSRPYEIHPNLKETYERGKAGIKKYIAEEKLKEKLAREALHPNPELVKQLETKVSTIDDKVKVIFDEARDNSDFMQRFKGETIEQKLALRDYFNDTKNAEGYRLMSTGPNMTMGEYRNRYLGQERDPFAKEAIERANDVSYFQLQKDHKAEARDAAQLNSPFTPELVKQRHEAEIELYETKKKEFIHRGILKNHPDKAEQIEKKNYFDKEKLVSLCETYKESAKSFIKNLFKQEEKIEVKSVAKAVTKDEVPSQRTRNLINSWKESKPEDVQVAPIKAVAQKIEKKIGEPKVEQREKMKLVEGEYENILQRMRAMTQGGQKHSLTQR